MSNIRMLAPANATATAVYSVGNGSRSYSGVSPGSYRDVPDFDAAVLQANGWVWIAPSGPTSARPATTVSPGMPTVGGLFFDTTLGKLVAYDGATWRDPVNGNAA